MTLWKVQVERARQHDRGWVAPHERGDTRQTLTVKLPSGVTTAREARHHPFTLKRIPAGFRTIDARPWKEAA